MFRGIDSSHPEVVEKIRIEAAYFENQTERMRCPEFRAQHLFVGTGVIEAGCKGSARAASSRECSGPFGVPMPSWLCVAVNSTAGLKDYGEAQRA